MANPSTVWTQLSLPLSPAGSIPYVGVDKVTIGTDVLNFAYTDAAATLTGTFKPYQLTANGGLRIGYANNQSVPAGTTTINKPSGRVTVPIGTLGVTVMCSYCTASSVVLAQLETLDATLTRLVIIPLNGQFIVVGNANCTAAVGVNFVVSNGF